VVLEFADFGEQLRDEALWQSNPHFPSDSELRLHQVSLCLLASNERLWLHHTNVEDSAWLGGVRQSYGTVALLTHPPKDLQSKRLRAYLM
jgi:hypothetical protein